MAYEKALAALADPTRRSLMERLARRAENVGELASEFKVTRAAVSQHLRSLLEAELVTVRQEGTRRIYSARPEALGELRAYLDRMWGEALARLEEPEDG